ncbi:hypothetical protein D3C79_960770 [compost metagenome]
MAECDQAVFLVQLGSCIPWIAEDAEVCRPRALAHDEHSKGLARVARPTAIESCVLRNRHEGLLRRLEFFACIADRSTDDIARHDHEAQLVMVAKQ